MVESVTEVTGCHRCKHCKQNGNVYRSLHANYSLFEKNLSNLASKPDKLIWQVGDDLHIQSVLTRPDFQGKLLEISLAQVNQCTLDDIDKTVNSINDLLLTAAQAAGIRSIKLRHHKKKNNSNKRWFDDSCKKNKKQNVSLRETRN